MEKQQLTAVFIGHNEYYGLDDSKLREAIIAAINAGVTTFLNGGMGGFDWKCAYIVKTLKKEYPQIRSELIIPYLTFNPRSTDDFDEIVYPDGFEKYHFKSAIPARNKYMVDNSQYAICYVSHDWGGAFQTYSRAKKKGLTIINLGNYDK